MTQTNKEVERIIKEFKKWCSENTATFESYSAGDGYTDERNVSFDELSFYSDLVKKVKDTLTTYRESVEREIREEVLKASSGHIDINPMLAPHDEVGEKNVV